MRRTWMVLGITVLLATPALAGPAPTADEMWKKFSTSLPWPAEWQGVWSEVDSVYTSELDSALMCTSFAFDHVSSEQDTICAGQNILPPQPSGLPINYDCFGEADANSIQIDCDGAGVIAPDCSAQVGVIFRATRSGDTFVSVNQTAIHYIGAGCAGAPDAEKCFQHDIHATRTSLASTYCATPTKASTWGKVKALYR